MWSARATIRGKKRVFGETVDVEASRLSKLPRGKTKDARSPKFPKTRTGRQSDILCKRMVVAFSYNKKW
jgi:hypothetical protein